ncbi:Phospholipid scramblase 3, partial [Ophiophagus hannah]
VDQILIHQKVELQSVAEPITYFTLSTSRSPLSLSLLYPFLSAAFIGFEGNNKYEVRNSLGQHIFHAEEQNDCCTRNCCGSLRRFSMRIDDPSGREVIRLVRPLKCMEVQSPPGATIGYVVQTWHPFMPRFSIQNVEKETVLRVKTRDESRGVGRISKQWSGLLKEVFTDTDNFGIQFPIDLDVKVKAILLGACFLIDFMFFEKTGEVGQRNSVMSS